MTSKTDIKKQVRRWAKRVGVPQAIGILIGAGVSVRAAERLCLGTYDSQPKKLVSTLEKVMAESAPTDQAS